MGCCGKETPKERYEKRKAEMKKGSQERGKALLCELEKADPVTKRNEARLIKRLKEEK